MVKLITLLAASSVLVGCGGKTAIKTETQMVRVPIMYCPLPNEIKRPDLPLDLLNEDAELLISDGEVVKHYVAQVKTLLGYTQELEIELEGYRKRHEESETLKKQLEDSIKTVQ